MENSLSSRDHLNLGLATSDGEECWQAKPTNPIYVRAVTVDEAHVICHW